VRTSHLAARVSQPPASNTFRRYFASLNPHSCRKSLKLWPAEGYITAATIEAKGEVKTSLELAHDGVHEMHTPEAAQALREKYSPWALGEGGASGAQQRHQKELQLARQRHREEMDRPRGVVTTGNMPRTERLDRPKVRRY
jgi:hypothetical protein